MASNKIFIISGLLLVTITIVIQSAPIEKEKIVQSSSINNKEIINQDLLKSVESEKTSSISTSNTTNSISSTSSSSSTSQKIQEKKKRFIDIDLLDESSNSESNEENIHIKDNNDKNEHILHANIKETSAKIHDNTDKLLDTDDSKQFSDFKMTPNDLTNVIRRRREVKLNDQSNQRRKRALSPYDFYATDSFYDPYANLFEQEEYARPSRSFAPIYWYPSAYQRNIRSTLPPSFYKSAGWPRLYSNIINDDEIDENPTLIYGNDDDDDDENDYELNRYPILLPSPNLAYDNLELQQTYNTDDLPYDEDLEQNYNNNNNDDDDDDDDERFDFINQKNRPYYTRYGPIETYI